ncbi:1,3-propanediol dehydrogenase [Rosistilla carotiformis]|uniref:1,3-propanediol dehydrogenase n=1 Tax=Rosistilla carotiformis TaxID=2528017 RepID=A0A518K044_9BACT|nr:iron-containing alcohol dehydrogenase [Rosistilla carotiformis]QDV71095.1 1,3-propanediol dehydrogenase [Rosistilla carotiformis]
MLPFDFQLRPRIVFGAGVIEQLGPLASQLGGKVVLVVSDPGVVKAGHFGTGLQSLEAAGLVVHSFHEFTENPTTDFIDAGVEVARRVKPDLIVGLGGGSSMDCAKGINFVYSCGGQIKDYWGVGKATADLLPMIAVPTTSGTGSEAQSFALISDAKTHVKMACGDRRAACAIALLDPALTLTQPYAVTALTGIDALSHALETHVTTRRNAISSTFSREAFRLISNNLSRVLDASDDLEARGCMQFGACLAGMAIETSMLGAAHATANPLTARYGVTHGQAVGLMLPHVVRFNGQHYPELYSELLAEIDPRESQHDAPEQIAQRVTEVVRKAGLKTTLRELGIAAEVLPELAADASQQWTGSFNPVPVNADNLLTLYQAAL